MREWLGTPTGRIFQALLGIALLWGGAALLTVVGLIVMTAGLVTTVAAAAPSFLAPAPVPVFQRRRPPA